MQRLRQLTFASLQCDRKKRKTRREIFPAPSSARNGSNARDPEMHRTRKGNRWHFGMKLHIGDCESISPIPNGADL